MTIYYLVNVGVFINMGPLKCFTHFDNYLFDSKKKAKKAIIIHKIYFIIDQNRHLKLYTKEYADKLIGYYKNKQYDEINKLFEENCGKIFTNDFNQQIDSRLEIKYEEIELGSLDNYNIEEVCNVYDKEFKFV